MYKLHTICRACGHDKLAKVFDLGLAPLANDFHGRDYQCAGYCPLSVVFCEKCTLAQLSVVVDPKILYSNYAYETSKSETMRLHFRSLWDAIKEQSKAESCIEIGSNDGDFLAFARENGAGIIAGIDAAENLATVAIRRGIPTVIGILDDETSKCAACFVTHADVIVARHVFAHADDWHKFIRNLDTLSNRDTLIAIEVPYVVDTLARVEFDQCYHEHLSYVSLKSMASLLEGTVFRMQKVIRFPIHGGAVAVFIRRRDCGIEPDASVNEFLSAENISLETWKNFSKLAWDRICALKIAVEMFSSAGKTVVGYGASAKSTVWISACGFTQKHIAFIVDNTPQKQGKYSPGTDIPIVPESELTNAKADYAVCYAWNFMPEIEAKNLAWIEGGGNFINPHEP